MGLLVWVECHWRFMICNNVQKIERVVRREHQEFLDLLLCTGIKS